MKKQSYSIRCSKHGGICRPTEIQLVETPGLDPRMVKMRYGQCSCFRVLSELQLKRYVESLELSEALS